MSRLEELGARIDSREARIGVIGLGYVGLPLALEFAKAGFAVTGFDLDEEKVSTLRAGESYLDDVPGAEVADAVARGRLAASADMGDLAACDVIHVCVPTPLTKTRDPDVSHLTRALDEICRRIRSGQLIILGSTTYPGTSHDLFVPMLQQTGLRVGIDFSLAFAPERIDPGNRAFPLRSVPKVVGGETPLCTELAAKAFGVVFERVVTVSSTQAAEMVKLLENTFRAINIGLANEVALMCDRLDLDVWEVIDAAATKPYGFMRFLPGPGLGGHCIPIDPSYLAWKMKSLNFQARFIELAVEINSQMPRHVVERVGDLLNEDRIAVNGSRVLILGVAYKPDVADVRESPAVEVIRLLAARGAAIDYHDSHVPQIEVEGTVYKGAELSDALLESADVVVILTQHSDVDYAHVAARTERIFDARNATAGLEAPRARIRKL